MRWLWALVMVASASNSTCPGSPSATHAKCEVSLAFESACETVSTEILDRIRDLEVPNEDAQIPDIMHTVLLDECAGPQLLPLQQSFVSGGEFMHNAHHGYIVGSP